MCLQQFIRTYPATSTERPEPAATNHKCIVFYGETPLTLAVNGKSRLPLQSELPAESTEQTTIQIGQINSEYYSTWNIDPEQPAPIGFELIGLRELHGQIDDHEYYIIGYARQILHHLQTSIYCPACGCPTEQHDGDWGRICPQCRHTQYPCVSPAVLVLIHDNNRILMASKPGWGKRYSVVAGFVEPGETLEECAIREALEETGVSIGNLVYKGSQPWPFPHQLMVGFFAEYLGGDIVVDTSELVDARWFDPSDMPELPGLVSLSRQLIDAWGAERG